MLEKKALSKIHAIEYVLQGFPGNNCLKIGSQNGVPLKTLPWESYF
jgi:hypothetical protein